MPTEQQLEEMLAGPDHITIRLVRDILSEENGMKTLQVPMHTCSWMHPACHGFQLRSMCACPATCADVLARGRYGSC
jgi:hypothetical protein